MSNYVVSVLTLEIISNTYNIALDIVAEAKKVEHLCIDRIRVVVLFDGKCADSDGRSEFISQFNVFVLI